MMTSNILPGSSSCQKFPPLSVELMKLTIVYIEGQNRSWSKKAKTGVRTWRGELRSECQPFEQTYKKVRSQLTDNY